MGEITIRPAMPEEYDDVAALMVAAYEQYMPGEDDDVSDEWRDLMAGYRDDIADVRSRLDAAELVVAVDGDELLASVTFYPPAIAGGKAAHYPGSTGAGWPADWASIRLLAVSPAARGRGLGRLLTMWSLDRARALGATQLGLHTTVLMDVARAMYERMGFARCAEYDFYPTPDFCVEAYHLPIDERRV